MRDFVVHEIDLGLLFAESAREAYRSGRTDDGVKAQARATTALERVESSLCQLEPPEREVSRTELVKLRYAVYALKSL